MPSFHAYSATHIYSAASQSPQLAYSTPVSEQPHKRTRLLPEQPATVCCPGRRAVVEQSATTYSVTVHGSLRRTPAGSTEEPSPRQTRHWWSSPPRHTPGRKSWWSSPQRHTPGLFLSNCANERPGLFLSSCAGVLKAASCLLIIEVTFVVVEISGDFLRDDSAVRDDSAARGDSAARDDSG